MERAKAIKIIQENNFEKKMGINSNKFSVNFNKFFEKGNFFQKKVKDENLKNGEKIKKRERSFQNQKTVECWSCSKIRHYHSQCPQEKEN